MSRFERQPLFVAGDGGYHTYRIPALVPGPGGLLLAFCEGRHESSGDAGRIDILLRRSADGGRTWDAPRVVVSAPPDTCGNPAPVLDARSGTLLLLFTRNPGAASEAMVAQGGAVRSVWVCRSRDGGRTWTSPREITDQVKAPSWTWYATGPCHGIQLRDGRLVVPCDHVRGVHMERARDPGHAHLILSDDGGEHWRTGGCAAAGTNESVVVETADGELYVNCRSDNGRRCRAVAWSRDRGASLGPTSWDEGLPDPICQGSALRYTLASEHGRDRVLFSNAAATERRERLSVRLSYDECGTWPVARTLHAGPSAYSDLAVAPDMTVCCLFEAGELRPYETLTLARFDLEWLTQGADRIDPRP